MNDPALLPLVALMSFCVGALAGMRLCSVLDRKLRDDTTRIKHESMLKEILARLPR